VLQTIGLKSEHTLAPLVCCFCSTTLTYSPYEHLNFPIILDMGFKIYNGVKFLLTYGLLFQHIVISLLMAWRIEIEIHE
jgi:hypothetical protein